MLLSPTAVLTGETVLAGIDDELSMLAVGIKEFKASDSDLA